LVIGLGIAAYGCSRNGDHSSSVSTGAGSTAPGSTIPSLTPPNTKIIARSGEGWLEEQDGRKILHLKGTPYEMGYQYGVLMGDQIEGVFQTLDAFINSYNLPAYLRPSVSYLAAQIFKPHFPQDVLDELRGMLDGIRKRNPNTPLAEHDLIFINSICDIGGIVNLDFIRCSSFAAWGDLTVDGKCFQTRNVDLMIGTGLELYPVVVINKPDGKIPFANPSWSGMIACASGLSARGIGIGQIWANSLDRNFGTPWGLTTRKLLSEGMNCEDGIRFFQAEKHRTYGCNFVFGDRGDGRGWPRGCTVESTAHFLAHFFDDDPKEDYALWNGQCYAIKIKDAVFRADSAMDPTIRCFQTASNGPSGDPRTASAYRNRYKGQADEILKYQQAGIKIGRAEAEAISRKVAMTSSLQCCVYENSDLQLWVAYSTFRGGQVIRAADEPYHRYDFNFYTPVVQASTDRSSYAPGDSQVITVNLSNLGGNRQLDLALSIKTAQGVYSYTGMVNPTKVILKQFENRTLSFTTTVPPNLPPGPCELVVELYEAGTRGMVDMSIVPWTVN
jgi:hypothetical protein